MSAQPAFRQLLTLVALFCALARADAQPPVPPVLEPGPGEETIDVLFPPDGLSLDDAIQWAQEATKRPFNYKDAEFKGKPKIMMAGKVKVPVKRIYEFWQSIFVTQGFAMVPMGPGEGDFIVVEFIQNSTLIKQRAVYVPVEDLSKYQTKAGEVIMTTIPLKHVKVENVRNAVTQLMTNRASEIAQEVLSANALIVVGFAPTVYALYQILMAMDIPIAAATLRFEIVRLENAVAEELQPIITELISSSGAQPGVPRQPRQPQEGIPITQEAPEPKIIADQRTNSLVVYAIESHLNEIKRLVSALDTKMTGIESDIHIYRLKNTNADDVEDTLRELLGQSSSRSTRGSGIRPGPGGGQPTTTSEAGQEVTVVADEHTNSLLITCTRTRYAQIEPIIKELDRRRPQVLVQAAIAELSDNDLRNIAVEITAVEGGQDRYRGAAATGFGLSVIQPRTSSTTGGTGGTGGTGTGGGSGTPTGSTGTVASGLGDFVRIPFLRGTGLGFTGLAAGIFEQNLNVPLLINLLESNTKVNLLSNASVLTNDNEESKIVVGREVPTSQNSFDPSGQSRTGFQDYQEASLELTISPHISNDNYLRLEIHLIVEAFQGAVDVTSGLPPPKSKREFQGSVTVADGKTVVIGGLVQDNTAETVDKVPFLGDIPLLGELFKSTSTTKEKGTLYLFVTPTILTDFKTLEDVSYERKLEIVKLEGNIRLVDPDFRIVRLDDQALDLDEIERSGNLDLPRYVPVVPVGEENAREIDGVPVKPHRTGWDQKIVDPAEGTVTIPVTGTVPEPPPGGVERK